MSDPESGEKAEAVARAFPTAENVPAVTPGRHE